MLVGMEVNLRPGLMDESKETLSGYFNFFLLALASFFEK